MLGKNVSILVPAHGANGADLTRLVQDIVDHPQRFVNNVNENIRRDGRRVWMTWTNNAIMDKNGKVAEILAIGSDITERRKAEVALRKSEARFRQLADAMPQLI